jgi:hypothetical protein
LSANSSRRALIQFLRSRFDPDNNVQFVFGGRDEGRTANVEGKAAESGTLADQFRFDKVAVMRQRLSLHIPGWYQHSACDHKHRGIAAAVLARHSYSSATRNLNRLIRGLRQLEQQSDSGGLGRHQAYAEQAEKLHVGFLRHAVQPVNHRFGEEGEHFKQRHARIADG